MTGKRAEIAEINRQSRPNPNKLVIKMPVTTINWNANPRVPLKGAEAISPKWRFKKKR